MSYILIFQITGSSSMTLRGEPLTISSIQEFHNVDWTQIEDYSLSAAD